MLEEDDPEAYTLQYPTLLRKRQPRACCQPNWIWISTGVAAGLSLLLAIVALAVAAHRPTGGSSSTASGGGTPPAPAPRRLVSKVAFGSCISYDLRPQKAIWEAVIASEPDAWIWAGDMAYLDVPVVSCDVQPSSCQCTLDYIRATRGMCNAGNFSHALRRMTHQVTNKDYRRFLDYMCPGAADSAAGLLPPPGSNLDVCPRPVLGTYDDHDSGANNRNKRMVEKDRYKNLFLDALGEPADSPRRNVARGLYSSVTLNEGVAGREVQVLLLDERYERDPLPCQMRRQWCEAILAQRNATDDWYAWCVDYLRDDGSGSGVGSCCFKDEQRAAWCQQAGSQQHPLYQAACDPTSSDFGNLALALTNSSGTWAMYDASSMDVWEDTALQKKLWPWLAQESPFCDLLGSSQRDWLSKQLATTSGSSGADFALRLVVSGSVPFGSMGYINKDTGLGVTYNCSGDDWACYQPAQVNFLHTVANASGSGCVVVLTGDFHYADIKVVQPGAAAPYMDMLQSQGLRRPVYQLMSSGMTDSTAQGAALADCDSSFGADLVGLRPGQGRCRYMAYPNFGMVQIDWDKQLVHLQVQDATGVGLAKAHDGTEMQLTVSLRNCQKVS